MDAAWNQLQTILNANGGTMVYSEMLEQVDYENRQYLAKLIQRERAKGTIKRNLKWDAEAKATVLTIELVS